MSRVSTLGKKQCKLTLIGSLCTVLIIHQHVRAPRWFPPLFALPLFSLTGIPLLPTGDDGKVQRMEFPPRLRRIRYAPAKKKAFKEIEDSMPQDGKQTGFLLGSRITTAATVLYPASISALSLSLLNRS